ncbi:MAG: thiolase family protein [Bdellovibrionota bacterium]
MRKYKMSYPSGNQVPVYIDGVRTPFVKSFGVFEETDGLELFSRTVDSLLRRTDIDPVEIDEIICGTVVPQIKNGNIARDAILNLGLPRHIHGYNLNRACTSSLQSVVNAAAGIKFGHHHLCLAGGVELLSDVPITYSKEARKFLLKVSKAKSTSARVQLLKDFNAKDWLPKPPALSEPLTGLTMGEHAEVMAKKNGISRLDQDKFAVNSHKKAAAAQEAGYFDEEIIPIWASTSYKECIERDNIIRKDTSLEAASELRPAFDKKYGSLTAANSSPLTDGASCTIIADEERAKNLGLKPKLKILDFDFVGVDPWDQLLIGPALTIPRLLRKNNLTVDNIDRFEIHEAFAAQVLSCTRSMASNEFCESYFGSTTAFGEIPEDKLNVNGGAIAIGHPFGATGTRLLATIANELIRSDKTLGVIAICAAGGMAGSLLVERMA